jgi:hypothetical protein
MKLSDPAVNAADGLVQHLLDQLKALGPGSPYRDKYVGFCAVTSATHIETLIKESTLQFCQKQNKYLHSILQKELKRFNARIKYKDLTELLDRFDAALAQRFRSMLQRLNRMTLSSSSHGYDVFQSYDSLLDLRHSFVHNINANFSQVSDADLLKYIDASKRFACAYHRSINQ